MPCFNFHPPGWREKNSFCCHIISRALALCLNQTPYKVKVETGCFRMISKNPEGKDCIAKIEHSWIIPEGQPEGKEVILDIAPIDNVNPNFPLLIPVGEEYDSHWRHSYQELQNPDFEDLRDPFFESYVHLTAKTIVDTVRDIDLSSKIFMELGLEIDIARILNKKLQFF